MRENVELIKEINRLRKDIADIKRSEEPSSGGIRATSAKVPTSVEGRGEDFEGSGSMSNVQKRRRLDTQKEEIQILRAKIDQFKG